MKLFSEKFPDIHTQAEFDAFATKLPEYDTGYLFQAAVLERRNVREWLEKIWQQYEPYADSNFLKELKTRFTERVWELYLGATILNRGFSLGKHNDQLPDFDVRIGNNGKRAAWIEAISVNKGTGVDRVPNMRYGVSIGLPEDEMSLRITQALKDKYDQYRTRITNGIVKANEPYIIATDSSDLDHPEVLPLILRVAYGIGSLTLRLPMPILGEKRNYNRADSFYQRKKVISKKNGEMVSSMFFLDPAHAGISAVIYSRQGILNVPRAYHELGESFLIAHNPLTMNPVIGLFPFGEEYMGDESGARTIRPRKEYMRPDAFKD